MKRFTLLLLFSLATGFVRAQADTAVATRNLNKSAQKMAQLFREKNYTEYVKYILPAVVKMAGGPDEMKRLIQDFLQQMQEQGYIIKDVSIGETSGFVTEGNELQSVVSQIMEMATPDGRIISTSYLIAVSADNGITWHFVDTAGRPLEEIRKAIPSISNKLVVPEVKTSVFP